MAAMRFKVARRAKLYGGTTMENRVQIFWGLALVALGVILLLGRILPINLGAFCWPTVLILLGVWLIVRPRMVGDERRVEQRLLGDIRRRGQWTMTDEEIWLGVGDIRLDLGEAELPAYETTLRVYGFVGELHLSVPKDVGVSVSSTAFLNETRLWGNKEEVFLSTITRRTPNYEHAERRINVISSFFVLELRVNQG
jgi:predicted membrane protein